MMRTLITLILLCISTQLFSQQLTYKATNPNFGGDTFNYQFLLSSAEAQNRFEDPNAGFGQDDRSDLEQFTENLNNQLLNSVSRSLFTSQFGEDGLVEGTYTFGTLEIEIFPSDDGLVINILDTTTGEQTQVIIPQ